MVSKDFAIIIITSIIILFLIVIFLVIKIQKLSKNNIKENFSSDDLAKVRTEINKIYDMDVEAIRNLGHISKSLLTGTNYHSTAPGTPGDLTIPANNTKFKGNVAVDGQITAGGIYGEDGLYIFNKGGVNINDMNGGGSLHVDGDISTSGNIFMGKSLSTSGIIGEDTLYIQNKGGVNINDINGGGNLHVDGNLQVVGDIMSLNSTISSRKMNNMYFSEDAIIYHDIISIIP